MPVLDFHICAKTRHGYENVNRQACFRETGTETTAYTLRLNKSTV